MVNPNLDLTGRSCPGRALSAKDFIAPSAFAFNTRTCQVGGLHGAMSFLSITASDLSDQLLKDFLGMESSQIVTMHIHSVDQNKAIKTVKRTITELDRNTIEEQKKAVRAGYDIDILPSDLATYGRDAKNLLKELQSQNERMFLLTFLVFNTGRTPQELETNVFQAASIAQKHNCQLIRLDWQQEQGLMSSLPLAHNLVETERALTTSSTAIFIPFTTQELFQAGPGALYYGLNALSNNLIMVDRKRLKNPNGLIWERPAAGNLSLPSGKSPTLSSPRTTISSCAIPRPRCDTKSRNVLRVNAALSIWSNPTVTCNWSKASVGKLTGQYGKSASLKADVLLG